MEAFDGIRDLFPERKKWLPVIKELVAFQLTGEWISEAPPCSPSKSDVDISVCRRMTVPHVCAFRFERMTLLGTTEPDGRCWFEMFE